jgi:hypothetical protein
MPAAVQPLCHLKRHNSSNIKAMGEAACASAPRPAQACAICKRMPKI